MIDGVIGVGVNTSYTISVTASGAKMEQCNAMTIYEINSLD